MIDVTTPDRSEGTEQATAWISPFADDGPVPTDRPSAQDPVRHSRDGRRSASLGHLRNVLAHIRRLFDRRNDG